MTKIIYSLSFLIFFTNPCNGQKKEQKLIKTAFKNYKSAILNDKGEEAINYVDSRTIAYYSDILELVKNADSIQINSLSFLDKVMVFSIRHRVKKEDILSFDGKSLFIYAIKSGMIGKESILNSSIGEVKLLNDFGKGQFLLNEQETPLYFHFYKESGKWKIDLTSIFPFSNIAFKQLVAESGQNETDYIFSLLEILTGNKPGSEIWEKVK